MAEDSPADFRVANSYELGKEQDDIARRWWGYFDQSNAHKKNFSKDWPRFYLTYAGRHYDGRQADWQSTPVINMTFSVIETIVPILTDSRPQIYVLPRKFQFDKAAQIFQDLLEYLWEANNMDIMLPKVLRLALIFGSGFVKVLHNPALRNGEGDIQIVPIDPSHIFPSPNARTLEEADWIIHAENLPRGLVQRIYGSFIAENTVGPEKPELSLKRDVTSQLSPTELGNEWMRNTDGSGAWQVNKTGEDSTANNDDLVTVLECWERTPQGMVQCVIVNNEVLVPQHLVYEHDRFPFVQFSDHPNTWSIWGMGEVQQVEKLQRDINSRRGHLVDILKFSANPMLVVDPAAGDFDEVIARPGLVLPVEGGPSSAGWLQPPSIPSALLEINAIDKMDFDNILGNVDVLQGKRPPGIEAGVAIEALQEAANVRMRLKARNLENSIKQLGELLILFMQEFYTTERVFRIAGQSVTLSGQPLTEDHFRTINEISGVDEVTGEPQVNPETKIPPVVDAQFDVRIGPGSTLPVSRSTQFQKVLTLYSMQLVDDVEVLKNSGLPHWDEILQRSRMYWQMKMQEQMAIQQAMTAPPDPNGIPDEQIMSDMEEVAGPPSEEEL